MAIVIFCLLFVSAACEAKELTDQSGRRVRLPDAPVRVVSLAPALTELAFALDAGALIVGRTQYSNYPPEVVSLPHVGSYYRPDVERILQLRPDLCLASADGTPEATLEKLASAGIPIVRLNPKTLAELRESIFLAGQALGRLHQAEAIGASFDEKLATLDKAVRARSAHALLGKTQERKPVRVLYMLQRSPIIAAGPGTFCTELVTRAGGENVVQTGALYPKLSSEEVLVLQPEVVIVALMDEGDGLPRKPTEAERIDLAAALGPVPALAHDRVWLVPPDIFNRPTLRSLDALGLLADILLPPQSTE